MQSSAQDGEAFEIISFHNCQGGLGVTLAEYQLSDKSRPTNSHILVQDIRVDGRAASDGRLRRGDKLVRINGQPIDGMTLAAAVTTLGYAIESGRATLAVSRDPALAAALSLSSAIGDKPKPDADADDGNDDEDGARSAEQAVPDKTVESEKGFPAESSDDGSAVTGNAGEDAVGRQTTAANRASAADGQRSTDSSASLFPSHLLTDNGSPVSDISYESPNERGRGFPMCSTPNSSIVDGAGAAVWQASVENPTSQALPVGGVARGTVTDSSKIKFEKLELAMSFLGIHLTKEQQAEIRLLAEPDGTGRVDYSKFVGKMRRLLHSRLSLLSQQNVSAAREPQRQHLAPSLRPSSVATTSGLRTSASTPQVFGHSTYSPRESKVGSLVAAVAEQTTRRHSPQLGSRRKATMRNVTQQTDADDVDCIGQLQQQIRDLESALRAKDQLCRTTELKASSMRKKLALSAAQCESLQSRLELAEAAQRASRKAEGDYEAVLSALELALGSKRQAPERPTDRNAESSVTLKKVAILGCQLRKAEESRKVYEVATEQLLSFARAVYDTADRSGAPDTGGSSEKMPNDDGDEKKAADAHAPSLRAIKQLADEALSVIKATHALLEKQALPFGWEEAYTADGRKYYLNHVTEETIWHHPLTKVDRRKLR